MTEDEEIERAETLIELGVEKRMSPIEAMEAAFHHAMIFTGRRFPRPGEVIMKMSPVIRDGLSRLTSDMIKDHPFYGNFSESERNRGYAMLKEEMRKFDARLKL